MTCKEAERPYEDRVRPALVLSSCRFGSIYDDYYSVCRAAPFSPETVRTVGDSAENHQIPL